LSPFSATIVQNSSNLRNDRNFATVGCAWSEIDSVSKDEARWKTTRRVPIPGKRAEIVGKPSRHPTCRVFKVPGSKKNGFVMRRRLRNFLPIVLIALTAQILAPIAVSWAATLAISDPLRAAEICSTGASQSDQSGAPRMHDGACSICCVAHAAAPVDTPEAPVATPFRRFERVVWLDRAPDLLGSRTGSNSQARAPPQLT